MRSILLFIAIAFTTLSTTAQEEQLQYAKDLIAQLIPGQLRSGLPEDFNEYSFDWNTSTQAWDTVQIGETVFQYGQSGIDLSYSSQKWKNNKWEDADWIEYYNINTVDPVEFDPLEALLYVPADSFKAVYTDVYPFGTLPLTEYYKRDAMGVLIEVETYLDYSLINPWEDKFLLTVQTNHYDEQGKLKDVVYFTPGVGLDTTYISYDINGRVSTIINSNPTWKDITYFQFDNLGRTLSELNIGFYEGQIDYQDSISYIHFEEGRYNKEFHQYDLDENKYEMNTHFEIDNTDPAETIHDTWYHFNGNDQLGERITSLFDEMNRLTSVLTETAFGNNPLSNSSLRTRDYDGSTSTSTSDPAEAPFDWYISQNRLYVSGALEMPEEVSLHSMNGQFIMGARFDNNSVALPDVSTGIYAIIAFDENGHFIGSSRIFIP